MIQNLRRYSDSWLFKGLLSVIVLCFVFFGVGDLIRNIIYDRPIAKVGSHSISMEELDRALKSEIQRLSAIRKSPVSIAELNQFGFVEKTLDRLVAQHLLEQEVSRLKIVASDNVIRQNIKSLQPFLKDGQFDSVQFKTILQNVGISEQMLVKDIRRQIIDQQFLLSFSEAATISPYYRDLLLSGMTSKRSFASVTIPLKSIILDEKLAPEDIEIYFDRNKDIYKKPENRDIKILKIDLHKLAQKVSVHEDDLKKTYNDRKNTYLDPEKRTVKKLIFKKQNEAENVLSLLKDGKKLKDISKKIVDLNIKTFDHVARTDWSEDNGETVFGLNVNEYTQITPYKGEFCIYVIDNILPQKPRAFEAVKADIEKEIKIERFQEEYKAIRRKIEDDLAGGAKLADIAKEYSLEIIPVKGLTKAGSELDAALKLKEIKKDIVEQSFDLGEGNASNVIDTSFDLAFVVFVEKIHAEKVPDLKDVFEKVKNDLILEKKNKKGAELAQKLANEAKSVNDLSKFASAHSFVFAHDQKYSRITIAENKELEKTRALGLYDRAFSLPLNKAIAGAVLDGFVVVMPEKDLGEKDIDSEKRNEIVKRLNALMHDAIASIIVESLKKSYSVDIKSKNLEAFLKLVIKSE
ncbi:MAG: Peptidyl-prolyl cis-trans isomerase D [Holosporales bacterium]